MIKKWNISVYLEDGAADDVYNLTGRDGLRLERERGGDRAGERRGSRKEKRETAREGRRERGEGREREGERRGEREERESKRERRRERGEERESKRERRRERGEEREQTKQQTVLASLKTLTCKTEFFGVREQHLLNPACVFVLSTWWNATSAYWSNHLKERKHKYGNWSPLPDSFRTSAVAVLFPARVAAVLISGLS